MAESNATMNAVLNVSQMVQQLQLLSGAVKGVAAVAAAASVAFAAWRAVSGIADTIFKSMVTAEGQINRLSSALLDAKKGVLEYQKAVKFASITPFDVTQVIDAAVALRTFQIDPFKQIKGSGKQVIEILGDMASATGQDLNMSVMAVTHAMTGQWELMQHHFQINSAMIPQLRGLTAGTQQYAEALMTFLGKQARFTDAMRKMGLSLQGMLSNLGDAVTLTLQGIGGVADSKMFLEGTTLYEKVRDSIKSVYEVVSNNAPLEDFTKQLDATGSVSEKTRMELGLTSQEASVFSASIKKFGADLSDPINKANLINDALAHGIDPNKLLGQGEKFNQYGRIIGQTFRTLWEVFIDPFFKLFADGVEEFLNYGQKLLGILAPVERLASVTQMTQKDIFNIVKQFGVGINTIGIEVDKDLNRRLLNTKSAFEKQMLILAIVFEFIKQLMMRDLKGIWDFIKAVASLVKELFTGIGEGFLAMFPGILSDIKEIADMLGLASKDASSIKPIMHAIGYIIGVLIVGAIRSWLFMIKSSIFAIMALQEWFKGIFTWGLMISNVIQKGWLGGTQALSKAWEGLSKIVFGVVSDIRTAWEGFSLAGVIDAAVSYAGNLAGRVAGSITAGLWSVINGMGAWANGMWDAIKNSQFVKFFSEAGSAVVDWFKGQTASPQTGAKSYAIGEWNVPNDMLANIHKGEMIIPAKESSILRRILMGPASPLSGASGPVAKAFAGMTAMLFGMTHAVTGAITALADATSQGQRDFYDALSKTGAANNEHPAAMGGTEGQHVAIAMERVMGADRTAGISGQRLVVHNGKVWRADPRYPGVWEVAPNISVPAGFQEGQSYFNDASGVPSAQNRITVPIAPETPAPGGNRPIGTTGANIQININGRGAAQFLEQNPGILSDQLMRLQAS